MRPLASGRILLMEDFTGRGPKRAVNYLNKDCNVRRADFVGCWILWPEKKNQWIARSVLYYLIKAKGAKRKNKLPLFFAFRLIAFAVFTDAFLMF